MYTDITIQAHNDHCARSSVVCCYHCPHKNCQPLSIPESGKYYHDVKFLLKMLEMVLKPYKSCLFDQMDWKHYTITLVKYLQSLLRPEVYPEMPDCAIAMVP